MSDEEYYPDNEELQEAVETANRIQSEEDEVTEIREKLFEKYGDPEVIAEVQELAESLEPSEGRYRGEQVSED